MANLKDLKPSITDLTEKEAWELVECLQKKRYVPIKEAKDD